MSSRRLHPTLADYVAIAINPVLVMGLVGSLIYFLLEVIYQGAYPDRLQFCLSMFIFAIVLISRIAMEEGFEHAAPFGLALAVVVALALGRFVDYGQGALAHFGWIINWGLMALTWWCAHQLTWDCTVIDDAEEVESQGLLETVGIDKTTGQTDAAESSSAQDNSDDEARDSAQRRGGKVLAGWEQVLNRKGKPHAPGVWVVYFSLASLPIFGIGQRFIPADHKASRRYVFALLCVYVACGLGLLLTTSFLALRRYLRGRRLEMPPIMAGTWLVTGSILIVALLLLVALLPRPSPEYAISEMPLRFGSQEHSSAKLAAGEEGTKDPQATQGSGVDHTRQPATEQQPTDGAGKQPSDGARDSTHPAAGSDKPGSPGDGQKESNHSQGSASGGQSPSKSEPPRPDGQKQDNSQTPPQAKHENRAPSKPPDRAGTKPAPAPSSQNPPNQNPPKQESSTPSPPAPRPSLGLAVGGFLAAVFKWVLYAVVIGAIAYFGWQSREALLAILRDWIVQFRDFLNALFGTTKKPAKDTLAPAAVLDVKRSLRFGDFTDPFDAGSAGQYPPRELIKYTFAALEAWGHEHGCERPLDATPHEFARQLGQQFEPLAAGSRLLAALYCRAVYSTADLPTENLNHVRQLWQTLQSLDAQLAQAVPSDGEPEIRQ